MHTSRERLEELLLLRAAAPISAAEAAELARLLAAHPGVDEEAYERAAAAVCLAVLDTSEAMPPRLQAAVERQAAAFLAATGGAQR